ncbi:hypothetical protein K439DRAFT_1659439 [Ramaria rubella]|nr:hypothetical protein K439DRAFT_1659439 [Ramaria rubella]
MATLNASTDTSRGTHRHLNLVLRDEALHHTQPAPTDSQHSQSQTEIGQQSQNPPPTSTPTGSVQHPPQHQASSQNPDPNISLPRTDTNTSADDTATESPSISTVEAQIAKLLAIKSRLAAAKPTHSAPAALFTDEDTIEVAWVAAITSALSRGDKKPVLPAIVPGFKSSTLDLLEDAFRTFCYIPYSTLTPAARVKAERGDKDFTFNVSGGITAKGLDRCTERSISMIDWHAASKMAVDRTCFHWGDTCAEALVTHNTLVMELARSHNWEIAMDYDIQQREAVSRNPAHDLASLDTSALAIISTRLTLRPSPHTYAPQHTTSHPLPLPKRPASTDPSQPSSRKRSRPEQALCFWCGLTGHLPADCKAK